MTVSDDGSKPLNHDEAPLIAPDGTQPSRFRAWYAKYRPALLLFVMLWLSANAQSAPGPYTADLYVDYFGSDQEAAKWITIVQSVSSALTIYTAVFFGQLLDSVGRRPFLIYTAVYNGISALALQLFPSLPIVYLLTFRGLGMIQAASSFAYLSDFYSGPTLAKLIAAAMALSNIPYIVLAMQLTCTRTVVLWTAVGLSGVAALWTYFLIPESLPVHRRQKFELKKLHNPIRDFRSLVKSRVTLGSIVVLGCIWVSQVGVSDVYRFYLLARVNFTVQEFAILNAEIGLTSAFALLCVVPLLLRLVSPVMVVFIALLFLIIEQVVIATIWTAWPVFALAVPCFSLTLISIPVMTTIVSKAGSDEERGRRLSALGALEDLFSAMGGLIFGQIFANVSKSLFILPFLISGVLAIPAGIFTLRVHKWEELENAEKAAATTSLKAEAPFVDDDDRLAHNRDPDPPT